jgi:hypothetical protein
VRVLSPRNFTSALNTFMVAAGVATSAVPPCGTYRTGLWSGLIGRANHLNLVALLVRGKGARRLRAGTGMMHGAARRIRAPPAPRRHGARSRRRLDRAVGSDLVGGGQAATPAGNRQLAPSWSTSLPQPDARRSR